MEPDISNSTVNLISPADCTHTPTMTNTFWWDYVEDAEGYNLTIVSPGFDSISRLVIDTNMATNKFIYSLSPGNYQWAVYAYNASSSTLASVFTIIIDTSNNLSDQVLMLDLPRVDKNTNITYIQFKWLKLEGLADYYIFEIKDSAFVNTIFWENTEDDTISVKLGEGKYQWGVSAWDNSNSHTNISTRFLTIDTTSPGKPIISMPVKDGDTIKTEPYHVQWSHPLGSLSEIYDSIWIASDSLFTSPDGFYIKANELSISDFDDGKYYVKVKSIDAAGNKSAESKTRKFYLFKL
jgi:hypothetical protein